MLRLLHNIHKPDAKATRPMLYVSTTSEFPTPVLKIGPFVLGTKSAELWAGILIQFLNSPETCVLSPEQVLSIIESNVCQPLSMLAKLGGRFFGGHRASRNPRVGDPSCRHQSRGIALYATFVGDYPEQCLDKLTELSEWDPRGGCRELATILRNKDLDFPVATEDDFEHLNLKLLIATFDKEAPNVSEIGFLLMDAFGDASNPRFYNLVVTRVLDDLDIAHPDYTSVLQTIQTVCSGVARKLRNYLKSGGKNVNTGPSSSSGPSTRSRSKRT
ncbi:hypothetical protein B0H13DRAFT_1888292 [Mycena leptocephala]|nr:hypothetical protein B0H13DRAFT_1888292 [Mycena leptocephala]